MSEVSEAHKMQIRAEMERILNYRQTLEQENKRLKGIRDEQKTCKASLVTLMQDAGINTINNNAYPFKFSVINKTKVKKASAKEFASIVKEVVGADVFDRIEKLAQERHGKVVQESTLKIDPLGKRKTAEFEARKKARATGSDLPFKFDE